MKNKELFKKAVYAGVSVNDAGALCGYNRKEAKALFENPEFVVDYESHRLRR